jgi:hypothetical protein
MHALALARAAVSSLLVAAAIVTVAVVLRTPPPMTIVVVPITAPVVERTVLGAPAWCVGYDWRVSSVDLRPYCGYR